MEYYQTTLEDFIELDKGMTAGELEERMLEKGVRITDDISADSGLSIEELRYFYLGLHNNEIVDTEIARRIIESL